MTAGPVNIQNGYVVNNAAAWIPSTNPDAPPVPAPSILTRDEAARFFRAPGVGGRRALDYYVREGKIRPIRFGRSYLFPLTEIQRFIAEQAKGAANG